MHVLHTTWKYDLGHTSTILLLPTTPTVRSCGDYSGRSSQTRFHVETRRRGLTGEEQAGQGDDIELLDGDVVVVHEEVQEVDGQVAGGGAQLVAVAQNGQQVGKVATHADLWRERPVGR